MYLTRYCEICGKPYHLHVNDEGRIIKVTGVNPGERVCVHVKKKFERKRDWVVRKVGNEVYLEKLEGVD